ncbi:uncharacterized protein LOC111084059, partial [Limulus polyphemus]|uniref:Uncharacterized protein LOC111084059 n=1 Tax=Limulus polyphemus TaxID=6850 RepID=A0ABM1RYU2_LIMPO
SGQSDLQFKREPSSLMYDPSVNRAVFRCSVAPANAEVNWLWNGKLVNNSLNYLKFKENRRKLIVAFPSGGKWFLEKQKENIFQCVVSLGGKALVSRPAKLIVSELSSFPPQEDVRLSVVVGNVAVIPCKPPPGVPRVITKFVFDNRNIDKTE